MLYNYFKLYKIIIYINKLESLMLKLQIQLLFILSKKSFNLK